MALQQIDKGALANDKTGTPARQAADIINQNFDTLKTVIENIQFPDAVLKKGNIETSGLNIHVDADAFEWRIDQVDYFDAPEFDAVLDAATDGYYRKDVLLGNASGGYNIFKGTEDPVSASEPNVFPVGTIKLEVIDVYGADVTGTVPVDLSGYATKDELNDAIALEAQNRAYADDDINAEITYIESQLELLSENKADLTYVNSKLSSVLRYKFSVPNYASLPSSGNEVGDVYNLTDTGHNYAWTGTVWDDLGPAVDVSGKEDASNKTDDIEGNKTSSLKYISPKAVVIWLLNYLFSNTPAKASVLVDSDLILAGDSADSFKTKSRTFAQLKATLKTYFDTLYGNGTVYVSYPFIKYFTLNTQNWYIRAQAELPQITADSGTTVLVTALSGVAPGNNVCVAPFDMKLTSVVTAERPGSSTSIGIVKGTPSSEYVLTSVVTLFESPFVATPSRIYEFDDTQPVISKGQLVRMAIRHNTTGLSVSTDSFTLTFKKI